MAIMRSYTRPTKKLVTDDSSEGPLKFIDPPGVVSADTREPTDYGMADKASYNGGFPPKG